MKRLFLLLDQQKWLLKDHNQGELIMKDIREGADELKYFDVQHPETGDSVRLFVRPSRVSSCALLET